MHQSHLLNRSILIHLGTRNIRNRNQSDVFESRGQRIPRDDPPRRQFNPATEFGQQFPSRDFRPTRDRFQNRNSYSSKRSSGNRKEFSPRDSRGSPTRTILSPIRNSISGLARAVFFPSSRPFPRAFCGFRFRPVWRQKQRFGVRYGVPTRER